MADSIKVALGNGNWAHGSYCFWSLRQIITLFRMPRCPMPKEAFIESAIHEKEPRYNETFL